MKRPSFQFYPADWRNNAKLRRCSDAARGAWMDVLCVLHDSDEYGICRWPLAELARAAGVTMKALRELVSKDVLKGADKDCAPYVFKPRHAGKDGDPVVLVAESPDPCWYCTRFVRDEWVRLRRGSGTQFTPSNQPPKGAPKPPIGELSGDGSTSASTSAVIPSEPNGSGTDGAEDADAIAAKALALAAEQAAAAEREAAAQAAAEKAAADKRKRVTDPDEIIFGYGVPLLVNAGTDDKHARSFLGGLRKMHGDVAVVDTLRKCLMEKPLQPLTWLAAALPPPAASKGKHAGFADKNYREGVAADGSFV